MFEHELASPKWLTWSLDALEGATLAGPLLINDVVFAEVSIGFLHLETVVSVLGKMQIDIAAAPREALFQAGKAYRRYRASTGTKTGVLPDFFIGAHAMVLGQPLVTRDSRRYHTYFPQLELIAP